MQQYNEKKGLRVAAEFKKINYSNVTVKLEKWNSATFSWQYSSTDSFNYIVNPPKHVIEDQATYGMLNSGRYRVTLGGTITTVEDGTFAASTQFPATFEVE
ncbi:hypothetical protein [Paenibacillus sp. UMB4589-SE434]|uniref:hypothetical protein n=1 Tax=Paenibacillus sp. UMB4589-SE434 TaxID=3046314 RepID=UPI0025501A8D|nr:hypothetical protein [Paenibacillus sp. UMB4589-SE434]MDK8181721.1 hypothetical protein [Paenibacillus sp. UMB4589-SE434]